MPEHQLEPGQRWIANLMAVGEALLYVPDAEFDVSAHKDEQSPVDVAWRRGEQDTVPLFVFEVESRPSGQMAQNAGKVLSQPTELFEKPLFLFHVVVSGGSSSTRTRVAQQLYGTYNYRIYLASQPGQATQVLCDVLSQHRRVSGHLDPVALVGALEAQPLPAVDVDRVLAHAEACSFHVPWLRAYALLSIDRPPMRERLAKMMQAELGDDRPDGSQYGTWLGQFYSRLLHLGLLAALDSASGPQCLQALERWQSRRPRPIAPQPGNNEDYDNFVFARAPSVWALIAVLLRDVDGGPRWVLEQMALILGSEERPYPLELGGFCALWMLHVAHAFDCPEAYARARAYLNGQGGARRVLMLEPPIAGAPMADLDDWGEQLRADAEPVPEPHELGDQAGGQDLDPVAAALRALLELDRPDEASVVRALLGLRRVEGPPVAPPD
jgi:hypothetical protein